MKTVYTKDEIKKLTRKQKADLVAWYRLNSMSLKAESRAAYIEGDKDGGLWFLEEASRYWAVADQLEAFL